MSGCGILTNGKGTRREYCEFSLDELQVKHVNTRVNISFSLFLVNLTLLSPLSTFRREITLG